MKIENVGSSLKSTRDEIEILNFTKYKESYVEDIIEICADHKYMTTGWI